MNINLPGNTKLPLFPTPYVPSLMTIHRFRHPFWWGYFGPLPSLPSGPRLFGFRLSEPLRNSFLFLNFSLNRRRTGSSFWILFNEIPLEVIDITEVGIVLEVL